MTQSSWQLWRDRRGRVSWLRVGTLVVLLMPLAKAVFQANDIAHGARPLNELIHRAGFWALVFLGVTLAVTPFRHILRTGNLIDVRRMLGVGTFCYIAAHLALFFADQSYSLGKVIHEITHRVYLVVGAVAWLGLAALAATSTDGMVRRLGGNRWRRLHQIIYVIALLALIHYFQQTKADVTVPTFAASLFLWLIAYRVLAWWQDTSELTDLEPDRACRRSIRPHVYRRGGRSCDRFSCVATACSRHDVRFRCRHQAGLAGAGCRPRGCRDRCRDGAMETPPGANAGGCRGIKFRQILRLS